jgi:transcription-repair coupling factor (superfamily II helicase)
VTATVLRDGKDLVFSYKNRALAGQLAKQSRGRVKVVDEKSAYLRLQPEEDEPGEMYELVRGILRERTSVA